jgi:hypothetical protein
MRSRDPESAISSGLTPIADVIVQRGDRRSGPILLQNSLKVMSRSDSIMLMRIGGAGDDGPE